jgi:hypothetical protein
MGGTPMKPPATRQRRNRKTTAAKLATDHVVKAPPLPKLPEGRAWHQATRAEWREIWASPMATQFLKSDAHGLLKLAVLINDFWHAETAKERAALLVEIRLQRQDFGLAPRPRASLHWEIERANDAQDRGARRRRERVAPKQASTDPRMALQVLPGGG